MNSYSMEYIAGLLDGEGYIGAYRRKPTKANKLKSAAYTIRISISMTDLEPIEYFAAAFGISSLIEKRDRGVNQLYLMNGGRRCA